MHIKSIVLEGFKSYGQRTEVNGFDPQFNAITGLNGTGKSNILDSICFVLGISNLSQVRAASLQDLIYRSGQAGVVKANVSITFDNTNPEHSPPGLEEYREITISRQVVMGGKSKYFLNGSIVQNKRIHDLFCSIQLNVNNPHFLIMQGRITKVLNMKPIEILSMIEEAAGTRLYETKRQQADKTIQKKEAKLLEIVNIMDEEIGPKLEKLRQERAAYQEFENLARELEHMKTIYQAWQFCASQRNCILAEKALNEGLAKVDNLKGNINQNETEIKNLEKQIEDMTSAVGRETTGTLQKIEAELKSSEKAEAKICAAEKSLKDNINTEEKKKKQLQKNLQDDESTLKAREGEFEKLQGVFQELRDKDAADNEAFAVSQKRYEALCVGMEVNDAGETETLQDQLMYSKQRVSEANTEIKQATMQLNHLKNQLEVKEKEVGSNTSDYERDEKNLKTKENEIHNLEKSLKNTNFSQESMQELQNCHRQLKTDTRNLQDKIDRFQARYPYTFFDYQNPENNFDRRKVKGIVCRLIKLKSRESSIAIETAAGGKLYNVIVDTDHTCKQLLQKGNLQNRTTFIPLNKIQSGRINDRTVKLAQNLVGKENVQAAISLIEYDKQLQQAMEYVFGNVFVCKDLDTARRVAFHEGIKCRCVTLEGDTVDPAGILSGGAVQKGASVLVQLEDSQQYEEQLKANECELTKTEAKLRQLLESQKQWMILKQQLDVHQYEASLIKQRLQQTTHHIQKEEINGIKQKIDELKTKMQECKEIEVNYNNKVKELEGKIKGGKGHRDQMLKEAEETMKKLKKAADNSRKNWKQREQQCETLTLDIEEIKKGIVNTQEQIVATEKHIEELKVQHADIKNEANEKREIVSKLLQECKAEKQILAEKNKDLQKKVQKKEQLLQQISDIKLEIQKQDHEIKKLDEEYKLSKKRKSDLSKVAQKNDIVKEAEQMDDQSAMKLEKKIRKAQERRNEIGRKINAKAQGSFEHEEKMYSDLVRKKKIVENDKLKILKVMQDLDKKKREVLLLAYEQVNKDFGSIFGTLLPGSNAKLEPPSGQSVLQGLEIKICLGGVWKESLSELSGGQRSLVALSLILAMLLFKPAPLYILDEVDAALDLSHTQNVGNMLRTHFKQSQFIIVSLKDGMFNNANVLFRTKFSDSVSKVTRTVNTAPH